MDCFVSANTWTHIDLASESAPWRGDGWRMVEAQHKIATMGIVGGDVRAQTVLEDILESSKPPLPPETRGLHWLLATPFRYPPSPGGSRFRGRGDPGVFYGAEDRETACAEAGYWRLRFWLDSDALRNRAKSIPVTLFQFRAAAAKLVDLTLAPFRAHHTTWTDPDDYAGTQALAEKARQAGVEAIRYASVRHPPGMCLALLTPAAFRRASKPFRDVQQTWTLHIEPPGHIVFRRDLSDEVFQFAFGPG